MVTDAQRRATERYRKKSTKQIIVRFYPADMDVYEHLRAQDNMAGYVKRLIREDMERTRAASAGEADSAGEAVADNAGNADNAGDAAPDAGAGKPDAGEEAGEQRPGQCGRP